MIRKVQSSFDKVKILMDTAFELEKVTKIKIVTDELFDQLMNKLESQITLLYYIYEQVTFYMFEQVSVHMQAKEFKRLIEIPNLKSEFSNGLSQWIKVYNA